MKLLDGFLNSMRSLSEGTKSLLLIIFILGAGALIFKGWLATVSYRLNGLSITSVSEEKISPVPFQSPAESTFPQPPPISTEKPQEASVPENVEALGPWAGLKESLKSLEDLISGYPGSLSQKKNASLFLSGMVSKIIDLSGQGWNYIKSLPSSIFRSKDWVEN